MYTYAPSNQHSIYETSRVMQTSLEVHNQTKPTKSESSSDRNHRRNSLGNPKHDRLRVRQDKRDVTPPNTRRRIFRTRRFIFLPVRLGPHVIETNLTLFPSPRLPHTHRRRFITPPPLDRSQQVGIRADVRSIRGWRRRMGCGGRDFNWGRGSGGGGVAGRIGGKWVGADWTCWGWSWPSAVTAAVHTAEPENC